MRPGPPDRRSPASRSRAWRASGIAGCAVTHATLLAVLLFWGLAAACSGGRPPPIFTPEIEEPEIELPQAEDSLRFAVIGDSGTGNAGQYEIAGLMTLYHDAFPFELVIMAGDNLYGSEDPYDYEVKFERPYGELLARGVKFYASLGNHDELSQRLYDRFNMAGRAYYSFRPEGHDVRFFALNSDYLDGAQLDWLEEELAGSDERWKIAFFHHPIYSSGGRHGADLALREALEPLFIEHGVDVVFTGHEHFYERIEPQNDIVYFISGGAGKLRRGDLGDIGITAAGYDQDLHFILVEIDDDKMHFQAVSRLGETVDKGSITETRSATAERQ